MFNFNLKNNQVNFYKHTAEVQAIAQRYAEQIRKDLHEDKLNRFYLGTHLIDLYRSNSYCYLSPVTAGNCHARYFFQFCEEMFDLDKSQVSRLMNVVDEFGEDLRGFRKEYRDYSYSVLVEMLPLTPEQRKPITAEWTVKRVREYRKTLVGDGCDVATLENAPEPVENSANGDSCGAATPEDASEEVLPPELWKYQRWTRYQLAKRVDELELEKAELLETLSRYL